jgi:hypothetical protein
MHKRLHRRLVAIVYESLRTMNYSHVSDLAEDVKTTASRQRIPYEATAISAALAVVAYRRPLVCSWTGSAGRHE